MINAKRFAEIAEEQKLILKKKIRNSNIVDITINPLDLDTICGLVNDYELDCLYDSEAIPNHTLEICIYS